MEIKEKEAFRSFKKGNTIKIGALAKVPREADRIHNGSHK